MLTSFNNIFFLYLNEKKGVNLQFNKAEIIQKN